MTGDDTSGGAGDDGADRRTQERVPARVEVRFTEANQAARALRAFSINVSSGGLCLRTQRRYEIGATLQLTLNVAGEEYPLAGIVAWVREGAVGVRFVNLTPDDRSRIEALVSSLKKAQDDAPTSG